VLCCEVFEHKLQVVHKRMSSTEGKLVHFAEFARQRRRSVFSEEEP
jgi:hypothetical protein